jgi:hypothetical protein
LMVVETFTTPVELDWERSQRNEILYTS